MAFNGRVIVVVSDEYAPSLERFADECPVWAIRTPAVEAVASRVWAVEAKSDPREAGLTLFSGPDSVEDSLASIIGEVELHHGPASGTRQIRTLEVLGMNATGSVRQILLSLGFSQVASTAAGFVASRSE
jgi:hypothetical protein